MLLMNIPVALEKMYIALCGVYLYVLNRVEMRTLLNLWCSYDFLCSLPFDWGLMTGQDGLRRTGSLSTRCVKAFGVPVMHR